MKKRNMNGNKRRFFGAEVKWVSGLRARKSPLGFLFLLFVLSLSFSYAQQTIDITATDAVNSNELVTKSQLDAVAASNTDDQTLTLTGNTLTLESGGTVDLTPYLDNTDGQTITDFSLSGNILSLTLSGGNTDTVDLGPIIGAAVSLDPADIGASDKTLVSSDFSKFNYTDDDVVLTVDNSVAIGSRAAFQPTGASNTITLLPDTGVTFVGVVDNSGTLEVITDGFAATTQNLGQIFKLADNLFSVSGNIIPASSETVPEIEGFLTNWANGTGDATVGKPTGVQNDEAILILVGSDAQDQATAQFSQAEAPTGFTFGATAGDATSDAHVAAYHRIIDGTEGSSFTVAIKNSNDSWIAALRISDIDTTDPVGIVGSSTTVTGSSITIPEITTTQANSKVIAFVGTDGSDVNYSSLTGAGWVLGSAVEGADGTDNTNGVWIYKDMPTAGASESPTINFSASDGLVGFMFEIKSN